MLLDERESDEFISSYSFEEVKYFGDDFLSGTGNIIMRNDLNMVTSRRKELLELIAAAADEIASIDRSLPILYSQALETDLLQGGEKNASSNPLAPTQLGQMIIQEGIDCSEAAYVDPQYEYLQKHKSEGITLADLRRRCASQR